MLLTDTWSVGSFLIIDVKVNLDRMNCADAYFLQEKNNFLGATSNPCPTCSGRAFGWRRRTTDKTHSLSLWKGSHSKGQPVHSTNSGAACITSDR